MKSHLLQGVLNHYIRNASNQQPHLALAFIFVLVLVLVLALALVLAFVFACSFALPPIQNSEDGGGVGDFKDLTTGYKNVCIKRHSTMGSKGPRLGSRVQDYRLLKRSFY